MPWVKGVDVCQRATVQGVRESVPLLAKIFKIKVARIALVAIYLSKYKHHIIELASHYAQKQRFEIMITNK